MIVLFVGFDSRVRAINHIDDKRRPKCKDSLAGFVSSRLSNAEVELVDARDRNEHALARKNGHTHVMAKARASRVAQ